MSKEEKEKYYAELGKEMENLPDPQIVIMSELGDTAFAILIVALIIMSISILSNLFTSW